MYDLIIIGGGPAALSAASYALSNGLNLALIYEKLGGKISWPQSLADLDEERRLPGSEVVRLLTLRAAEHRSALIQDHAEAIIAGGDRFEVSTTEHGLLSAHALIIATGATPSRLGVPGAQRLVHHGLGYSIRTYGHLVGGRRVAVIGVTPRALRGAAELARSAARVSLIAPDAASACSPLATALCQRSNIELLAGYSVAEVLGQGQLAGLRLLHTDSQRTLLLDVDHAFVDLGLTPNSRLVRDLVQLDSRGFIIVDQYNATSRPGVFAAGDVTAMPGEQVLVAVGDGARAAMCAYDYLLAYDLAATAAAPF